MHIIFGNSHQELFNNFTVLELDTFHNPVDNQRITAYCVVDVIPLTEFPLVEARKKVHSDLILCYSNQHWDYCETAIGELMGKWNGSLDSFYSNLLQRITEYKDIVLPEGWDGSVEKL